MSRVLSFVWGIAGAGDVNGDGYDDLLLHVTESSGNDHRHVVVFGNPFLPETVVIDPGSLTPAKGLELGFIVSLGFGFAGTFNNLALPYDWVFNQGLGGMGDLNGNGYDDIIFGDPEVEPAGGGFFGDAGRDYVLFGANLSGWTTLENSPGDDFLLGDRQNDDILIGAQGNDALVGRGGRDVYYGGSGDDLLIVSGIGIPEYLRIDGGGGRDTVRLDGHDLVWDLGTTGNTNLNRAGNHLVESIEVIDLVRGGSGNRHTLILSFDDLADLPRGTRSLMIIGDASDKLTFKDSLTFDRRETRMETDLFGILQEIEFDVYQVDGTTFELLVAVGILVD